MRLKDHPKDQLSASVGKEKAHQQRFRSRPKRQSPLSKTAAIFWKAWQIGFVENYKPVAADDIARTVAWAAVAAFGLLAVLWIVP